MSHKSEKIGIGHTKTAMQMAILQLLNAHPATHMDMQPITTKEVLAQQSRGINYFHTIEEEVPKVTEMYAWTQWPRQPYVHQNSKWLISPAKKAHKRRISKRSRKINRR